MEWSKLKNIIIILLVLLNLFFFAIVFIQEMQSTKHEKDAQQNVLNILEKNGISVNSSVIPWNIRLSARSMERDRELERSLAAGILGGEISSDGGIDTKYTGAKGIVQFFRTGEFSVTLTGDSPSSASSNQAMVYFQQLGMETLVKDYQRRGNQTSVALWQTVENIPVFTCQIVMDYEKGSLRSIDGYRLMGSPSDEDKISLNTETLLIRFMSEILKTRDSCSRILAVTPGYTYQTGVSASIELIPTWYMETDGGVYLLNCLDGSLTRYTKNIEKY